MASGREDSCPGIVRAALLLKNEVTETVLVSVCFEGSMIVIVSKTVLVVTISTTLVLSGATVSICVRTEIYIPMVCPPVKDVTVCVLVVVPRFARAGVGRGL